jgi:hypothetical protein
LVRLIVRVPPHEWLDQLRLVSSSLELSLLLNCDPTLIFARVAAHPARALGKIVIPAKGALPPERRIFLEAEHKAAESPPDHPLSMMPAKRPHGRFHSLSSGREHTPIGVLPVS